MQDCIVSDAALHQNDWFVQDILSQSWYYFGKGVSG